MMRSRMDTAESWVAEFCPFCRGITAHRLLWRTPPRRAPLEARRPGQLERVCEGCGAAWKARRRHYAGTADRTSPPMDRLVRLTNPGLTEELADRLAREARVRAGSVAPGERAALLRESWEAAERFLADRPPPRLTLFDRRYAILLYVLGVSWMVSGLLPRRGWTMRNDLGLALLALVAGLGHSIYLRRTGAATRRLVEPLLARALAPLAPTLDELDAMLERSRGTPLSKALDARRLHRLLRDRA